MSLPPDIQEALTKAAVENRPVAEGRVTAIQGITVHVEGLRAAIGDLCTIEASSGKPIAAEVVGFAKTTAVTMPLGDRGGIAARDRVINRGRPLSVVTGNGLLGRVIDSLGRPLDGGPPLVGPLRPVTNNAPPALSRRPITEPVETGISSIDAFLTCGKGQRIGIFSGSGVGKSSLLGMIARGSSAEVNVIALIGERGREVREFIGEALGREGMARSVVIVATSDAPPMLRLKGPFTAVTIAEAFREQGRDVMFMMDSATRFAGAAREVGLAAGEPPTLRGFPPSLFSQLPRLIERLGSDDRGTITAMIAVLVDGDDLNEPVSDALRGHLDGHIVLSRQIAARGSYPAVDVLGSISRLMNRVTTTEQQDHAKRVRQLLAHYEENRDLVQIGAYRAGADPLLDTALEKMGQIEELLYHGEEIRPMGRSLDLLAKIVGPANGLGAANSGAR